MNVLLISREFPPFFGGGIGTYTRQFAAALAGAGHRAVVVTVSDDGHERREESGGATIVRLPFLRGDDWSGPHPAIATPEAVAAFHAFAAVSVFAMQVAGALPRLLDEFAIDVVEAPDTGALAWFALNARRIGSPGITGPGGPPLVTMVHSPTRWVGELNHELARHRRRIELILMERDSARWSDGLVCPSTGLAGWAEREWGAGPVRVVPYPLGDLEPIAAAAVDGSIAQADQPRRIAHVGRLEPRKGLDTLLEAFALALEAGADVGLDLVGQDTLDARTGRPFGASCLDALSQSVRSRIAVHGRLPPERVRAVTAGAVAAVIASPTDNYPYACLEAMAHGKVVIAARAGGMAELIRDGVDGLLFEPGNAGALAEVIARVGRDGEGAGALGRSAAARVLSVCGNEAVVRARVEHYRSVARRACGAQEDPEASVVLVNGTDLAAAEPLLRAARRPGIDFAHGWPRLASGTVLPFGTPCAESLARSPRRMGPLAVRAAALADARVRSRVAPAVVGPGRARVASTWELAVALDEAGFAGAVVPGCVLGLGPAPGQRRL